MKENRATHRYWYLIPEYRVPMLRISEPNLHNHNTENTNTHTGWDSMGNGSMFTGVDTGQNMLRGLRVKRITGIKAD